MNDSINQNLNADLLNSKFIDELVQKHKIDPQVFYSIKKMQQIPDEVIINFLNAESSLIKSEFKERIIID